MYYLFITNQMKHRQSEHLPSLFFGLGKAKSLGFSEILLVNWQKLVGCMCGAIDENDFHWLFPEPWPDN